MTLMCCDRCGAQGIHETYVGTPHYSQMLKQSGTNGIIRSMAWAYSMAMSGPHGKWIDVCEACNKEIETVIFKQWKPLHIN